MTPHRLHTSGVSFDAAILRALKEIFDEVWLSVRQEVANTPHDINSARVLLARIIFNLARDGQLGTFQIMRTAGRLVRQSLGADGRLVVA